MDETNAELPFGSSAVVGSCVASQIRRRGGGEDPWLCGPGFRRVCLVCRGRYGAVQGPSRQHWRDALMDTARVVSHRRDAFSDRAASNGS